MVATAAIIALLVVVIGVGIVNFTMSDHTVTSTSYSILTTSVVSIASKTTTQTQASTVFVNGTVTVVSTATQLSSEVSTSTVTPSTTVTLAQTTQVVSNITNAEASLYGGVSATSTSQGTASLLLAFNNPNSSTFITSILLVSQGGTTINAWDNSTSASTASNQVVFSSSHPGDNAVPGAQISFFTFYPESSSAIQLAHGQGFQYVVYFASGFFIAGSLVSQ
jgi:hypothetical protein